MKFERTSLHDAFYVQTEAHTDDRGYFARVRCQDEFSEQGIREQFVQTNLSYNAVAGTFRGLHFQLPPSKEGKLIRCVRGSVHDIIVDLRPDSESFLRHQWFQLSAEALNAVFIPGGFAHGFLTRVDGTLVMYEMTDYYNPELGRGLRWEDPALGIRLPDEIRVIAERDSSYPDLDISLLEGFRA